MSTFDGVRRSHGTYVGAACGILITVFLWLAPVLAVGQNSTSVVLVQDSRPRAVIVPLSASTEQEAVSELVRYVERATGAHLPVASGGAVKILVGAGACPPAVRERLRRLPPDGFLIEVTPRSVILAGNNSAGTAFAVYTFLERFLGVRWLWPGERGEVVPKMSSFVLEPVSLEQSPAYLWRDLGPNGPLWDAMDKRALEQYLGFSEQHRREQRLWEKRNRFGGGRVYGGHAFGEIISPYKYGPAHPEYFALVRGQRDWANFDGKHKRQLCTTNPDVVRLTIEYCRRFFDEHPEYEVFSISPNDGLGFCECERCRRLDTGATMMLEGAQYPVITDRLVTFANQVAEGVTRTHPDKKLIMFAYGLYNDPPVRVKPHPNLIFQYCFFASRLWNKQFEQSAYAHPAAWVQVARHMAIYEYFVVSDPDMPKLMPPLIARSVRRLHELGFRYYQTQHGDGYAINGFNYYVLSKLLWDPTLDVSAIRRDYVERGFGKAAPQVGRYFERLENQWRAIEGSGVSMEVFSLAEYERLARAYLTPQFRAACRRDLEQALEAATGPERDRVEFLRKGWRYVDLTMDAVEKTIPLLKAGWDLARDVTPPPSSDMGAFDASMAAWEERGRYVESLKDDFVLNYLWIRYNERFRSFNPLPRMLAYRKARSKRLQ